MATPPPLRKTLPYADAISTARINLDPLSQKRREREGERDWMDGLLQWKIARDEDLEIYGGELFVWDELRSFSIENCTDNWNKEVVIDKLDGII